MAAVPSAFLAVAGTEPPCAAEVRSVDARRGLLRLMLATEPAEATVSARWVALHGWIPAPGDQVLVLGDSAHGHFVVGPLAGEAGSPAPTRRIDLPGGGAAELDVDSGTLEVRNADASVLFSYRAAEGTGALRLEAGEVELAATRGDLKLSAAGRVRARAREVELDGEMGLTVTAGNRHGAVGSRLQLDRSGTRLQTRELDARIKQARGRVDRADWSGASWNLAVERMAVVAQRLESRAEVLVESVGSAYRKARELSQQSARRMRHLVDDSIQVRSRRILQRATEAFKVRGDKIHLG